jgi:phosphoribosylanthranilate isomerase
MKIKVCGMREMGNISDVIKLHPDYMGFIFYPGSKRFLDDDDETLQSLIKSIDTVSKVGVFVNESYPTILEAVRSYGLHYVQLHGNESAEFCTCLSGHVQVIKAFAIDEHFDFGKLTNYINCCAFFLFDTATPQYGGSGQTFDWGLLKKYTFSKKYFLSGGIDLDNISQIKTINDDRLMAIDVNSRFETAPGFKNIYKIKTLIHELQN